MSAFCDEKFDFDARYSCCGLAIVQAKSRTYVLISTATQYLYSLACTIAVLIIIADKYIIDEPIDVLVSMI